MCKNLYFELVHVKHLRSIEPSAGSECGVLCQIELK